MLRVGLIVGLALLAVLACTEPSESTDCAGFPAANEAGTPLPPCPSPTPVPETDRKAAYERGYSDSQDASCDVWRDLEGGRITPESADRELLDRKTRGADRYEAVALRVRYWTGWEDGERHISLAMDDVC